MLSDGTNDYVYGPTGTPVEQIALSTSTPIYLTYDASNNSWIAANESGDLSGFWGYDAYGSLLLGTAQSPFGYAGQYTDPVTGFSDDRARLYDPGIGTFTTRDPAFATTDTAYTYAEGDPVNSGDPSGLCDQPGTGGYLVPGPCEFSNPKWVSWAENNIHAQYAPPPWWERGLEGDADFFAGAANVVVSGITLGNVHISDPFCQYGWAYSVGRVYAYVGLGLLGVGELDAPAALEAVDEAEAVEARAVLEGVSGAPEEGGGAAARVFWSGGDAARTAATKFALENGGQTIDMTTEGEALEAATENMPWEQAEPLWEAASESFAQGATGETHVFINVEAANAGSLWATTELPGLVDNPNVLGVIFHLITG